MYFELEMRPAGAFWWIKSADLRFGVLERQVGEIVGEVYLPPTPLRLGWGTDSETRFGNRSGDSETEIRKPRFGNRDSENRDSETTIQKLRFGNCDSETHCLDSETPTLDSETAKWKLTQAG